MEQLWRLLPNVRASERDRFFFFGTLCGIITLAQTVGLVGAEALLLTHQGAEVLPQTFIAASALTVVGSLLYALGVDQSRNDIYFIWILLGLGLLIGGATVFAFQGASWSYPALFCLFYLSLAILMNHYWTFTGDFFDTLSAKRLFPLFVVGSSVGGLIGGVVAGLLAKSPVGSLLLLVAWVVTLALAALWIRLYKRQLRRWGPLELEEADETSISGLLASIRYLRTSSLGRWLVFSAVTMVMALFISQYLYSDVLARSYPDPEKLAEFLGYFLAATNLLEILIEVAITPFLIQRLGVASANLVHPVLTLVSFVALAANYSLLPALVARVNRETIENAISGPVRNLVYNALPARLRGRMRAFLEGIVVYSGMVLAGVTLLILQRTLKPFDLCLAGGGIAMLYLVANLKVLGAYLQTLVLEIRAGRIDFEAMGGELSGIPTNRLAELWKTLIAERDGRGALPLVPTMAQRRIFAPLKQGLEHSDARLRMACFEALDEAGELEERQIRKALLDSSPQIRIRALEEVDQAPESMLEDPDPRVVAAAASKCGEPGETCLAEMLQGDPARVQAALEFLPKTLASQMRDKLEAPEPKVVARALDCAIRFDLHLTGDYLEQVLTNSDHEVREKAISVLAQRAGSDSRSLKLLAGALADSHREVRSRAAQALGSLPDSVAVLAPRLSDHRYYTAASAVEALGISSSAEARALLAAELRRRIRRAWYDLVAHHHLKGQAFLAVALADSVDNNQRMCFRILEALEGSKVIGSVEKVLRFANARVRADALEVLSNLGDREASHLLVLLLEEGELDDKLPVVRSQLQLPEEPAKFLTALSERQERWFQLGKSEQEEELMESLLVLRKVPLFAQMTLEQLEAINNLLSEEQFLSRELVFREGDVGDELYVIVEGQVDIYRDHGSQAEILLTTLNPGAYFGEMAILDEQPRSATVVAHTDTRLLRLRGEQLKELIFQMPEIAFQIFKVLTNRIRTADNRLAEERKTNAAGDKEED